MANIDEIFDAMADEAAEAGHEYLVIDPETRTITVPESERIFGVTGDELADRKYFMCPRYVGDNLDLAGMFLTVYFRTATEYEDGYLVDDVAVNGDYVTFSWLLHPSVTAYKGKVQFTVCADLPNTAEKRRPDWNTTLAEGEVLEGLDPDVGDVEAETSDVVAQLREMVTAQTAAVEAAGAAQVANVQTEGTAQVNAVKATGAQTEADALAAIKAQGEATLASIPAEYTAMGTQVDKLTRDRAAAIVCQAEGELLQITDAGNDPLQGLRIFGKTTQHRPTGAQLLTFPYPDSTKSPHGVTFTVNTDGSIKITGTNAAADDVSCYFTLWRGQLEPGQYSYFCAGLPSTCVSNIYYIGDVATAEAKTFATTEGVEYSIVLRVKAGATVDAVVYPMLNAGDTVLPWEPYSGGVAGPNPAYPQALKTPPAPQVCVYGKNLADVSALELAANKSLDISADGYTVTVVGGSDKTYSYSHYDMPEALVRQLRGKTICLASDSITKSVESAYSPVQLNIKTASGLFYYPVNHDTRLQHLFTLPEDTVEIRVGIYTNNTANLLAEDNTVVVKGMRITLADSTEYEPYKEPQTLALQNELPGIPVESGGNYTDATGQQWLCDEVDLARGVYVQRLAHYIYDGSADENWYFLDAFNGAYVIEGARASMQYATPALCNYARRVSWGEGSQGTHYCFINGYDDFAIGGAEIMAQYPDLDTFKARLAAVPCEVIYQLETPVETALTDAEIQAYLALCSYKPTTTVLNDAGAHMVLEYAADPKTYIDNKLAALVAANS